jgi:hypothetical protein
VLAYLFWHRPRDASAIEAYEEAQICFHRSLARSPPVGLLGSATFRVPQLPWLSEPAEPAQEPAAAAPAAYEDWYLVEDYAALGVLNEAAVGRGHRTAHEGVARRSGGGSGGLYGLLEGDRAVIARRKSLLGDTPLAIWVGRSGDSRRPALGELLGDGMDPRHASLWRRQLVLGPAPEFCLLAREMPPGVAPTRLPDGWTARILAREALWSG